jgi:hypothetical protein
MSDTPLPSSQSLVVRPPSSGTARLALGIAGLGCVLAAAALSGVGYIVKTTMENPVLPALDQRLATQETRLEKLAGAIKAIPTTAPLDDALYQRMQQAEAKLAEPAPPANLTALEADLARLKDDQTLIRQGLTAQETIQAGLQTQLNAQKTGQSQMIGLLAAALIVRSALASDQLSTPSVTHALSILQSYPLPSPALQAAWAKLSDAERTNLPTRAALAGQLQALTLDLNRAENRAAATGWADRIWAEIRSLVVIRKAGENTIGEGPAGEPPFSAPTANALSPTAVTIAAQAVTDLQNGNLSQAMQRIQALPAAFEDVTRPWTAAASIRLQAEEAADQLTAGLLVQLLAEAPPVPAKTEGQAP